MWYGWVYTSSGWSRSCSSSTIGGCAALLSKQNPGVRNHFRCMTQGGVPTYTPYGIARIVEVPREEGEREENSLL
jgi:hypothetical protein